MSGSVFRCDEEVAAPEWDNHSDTIERVATTDPTSSPSPTPTPDPTSGAHARPDPGAHARPDSGAHARPDSGAHARPDSGAHAGTRPRCPRRTRLRCPRRIRPRSSGPIQRRIRVGPSPSGPGRTSAGTAAESRLCRCRSPTRPSRCMNRSRTRDPRRCRSPTAEPVQEPAGGPSVGEPPMALPPIVDESIVSGSGEGRRGPASLEPAAGARPEPGGPGRPAGHRGAAHRGALARADRRRRTGPGSRHHGGDRGRAAGGRGRGRRNSASRSRSPSPSWLPSRPGLHRPPRSEAAHGAPAAVETSSDSSRRSTCDPAATRPPTIHRAERSHGLSPVLRIAWQPWSWRGATRPESLGGRSGAGR